MYTKIFLLLLVSVFTCTGVFAMCGMCGSDYAGEEGARGMFSRVAGNAMVKDGVKQITYDQFMNIRESGEKYTLLDVLSSDSYDKGHIEGAASFPVDTINKTTAEKRLSKDGHIIVYCGSFQCTASTQAAKKLSDLGYDVLDYKGGLKEWEERGNKLVS